MPDPKPSDRRYPSALRRLMAGLSLICLIGVVHAADSEPTVRIGVLKFGTASWELDTVREHGFDRAQGFTLDVLPLAGKQATMVALQGGEVDMALNDWLWVSRQRDAGHDLTFLPFSSAAGSLVVPADSTAHSLTDLAGKRVGVAGGPLDKNWLLFRALAMHEGHPDPAGSVVPVFGAPPLLNKQLEQGRIDAVINFWPYAARLQAQGMRVLMDAREAAIKLGFEADLPLLGYVFDVEWAREHPQLIDGFAQAIAKARQLLASSDAEWDRLRPQMQAGNDAEFVALRDGFRAGIPQPMSASATESAARLLHLLAEVGGKDLAGPGDGLAPGTFWELRND